jgi:predicted transposase YbfD/YdcC
LRVDREVRTPDGEVLSHDVRYFVSSLDPDSVTAADLLRYVRDHWRLENGLHFLKDRWWDEDRHHTRRPGLSACLAAINNAALSIHRLRSDPKLPVRAAADYIAWNPDLGLQLLNS